MKILVISDSHGHADRLNQIVMHAQADHVIHCGDFCTETDQLPQSDLTVVQGNCDHAQVPAEEIFEASGIRFYITHGHRYQVKSTPLPIRYRGEEMGAQVVCFGHSHVPYCEQSEGILLLNPGSIVQPRGFTVPTYAILQINQDTIDVTFHQTDGEIIKQLGGSYVR